MSQRIDRPERVAGLATACRAVFGPEWSIARARELHRDLEQLIDAAEAAGRPLLADAALALAVYLCSFVEAEQAPAAALWPRVDLLASQLVDAGTGTPVATSTAQPAARPGTAAPVDTRAVARSPWVLQLASPTPLHLELAAEIGRRGCLTELVDTLPALVRQLERRHVDLVMLAPEWVDRSAEVLGEIIRCDRGQLAEPACLALVPADDRQRRLFALRAGVDRVVPLAPPSAIADSVMDCLAARQAAAFRVLVVEDDRSQALFAQSVLRHRGIVSQVAGSAAEAFAVLADFRPDLVLLDLHLPDRNGIEVAQLLRARPDFDFVQIVFLSGESSMEEHFRAIRLGGDAWLDKPVTPRHLLAVVDGRAERVRRLRASGIDVRGAALDRERLLEQLSAVRTARRTDVALVALAPLNPPRFGRDGLGFVAHGRLGDQIEQQLLALSTMSMGVCRAEPLLFLFLVVDDDGGRLADQLAVLRLALEQRCRPSLGEQSATGFALSAVAVGRGGADAEAWLRVALDGLEQACRSDSRQSLLLDAPAPTTEGSAQQRRLRRLFAAADLDAAARLSFRPVVPVRSHLSGCFAVDFSLADPASPDIAPITRAEATTFAAEHPAGDLLDRWLLGECLKRIRDAHEHGRSLRLLVPIGPRSIGDERLAAWLRTELTRVSLPGDSLVILVDAALLHGSPARAERALRTLAGASLRIAVGPLTDCPEDRDLCQLAEIAWLIIDDAAAMPTPLLSLAREYGKFVWLRGVDQVARLAPAFAVDAHWVSGDALSPPLPDVDFEFPGG